MSRPEADPKPTIHAIHGGRRVDRNTYDRMYAAYLESPSERHVASAAGVNRETARRAINEGYPRHNWPPLAERAREIHRKAAEAEDYDLVQAHRETLRALAAYKGRFLREFAETSLQAADVNLSTLERIAKLESFLCGGVEQRVELAAKGVVCNLSLEEQRQLIRASTEALALTEAEERASKENGTAQETYARR